MILDCAPPNFIDVLPFCFKNNVFVEKTGYYSEISLIGN
ncbi:hypothetical protein NMYAN_40207 [Nitrosomonas nitrosa]|uniref:Uncharacterized protein n=1 Tax=Nitrosomonas nitrosa TaxID=52442 RepID=A0A8H8Z2Z9_9PROT|nr:hypothetical protein NMYAN_40207 [Nitrosomonas nitrosa]